MLRDISPFADFFDAAPSLPLPIISFL